ncbi:MAG: DUF2118 domain-containing protein [Sulfolobales archaeon]|nr:DUF2118 domain-containing protein [Sulfolobales archaeon]
MNSYEYPEVFIEGSGEEPYISVVGEYYLLSKKVVSEKFYGHIIYEDVVEKALNLEELVTTKSMVVVPRLSLNKDLDGIFISKDTPICIDEVIGHAAVIHVSEGNAVSVGDKLASVVTGKGDVRTYRASCSGVIILVIGYVWLKPEKYIVVTVGEEHVRRISIKGAA